MLALQLFLLRPLYLLTAHETVARGVGVVTGTEEVTGLLAVSGWLNAADTEGIQGVKSSRRHTHNGVAVNLTNTRRRQSNRTGNLATARSRTQLFAQLVSHVHPYIASYIGSCSCLSADHSQIKKMHSTALSKHHQLPPQPFHSHSHSQACPFRRLAPLSSARTAASSNADSAATFLSLPLFPLPSALHPAQSGTLLVFEPRYLELFRPLQAQLSTPDAGGSEPKFGHILAASAAPPALMSSAVGGLPPLGVCATVKSIGELSNGRLQVRLCKGGEVSTGLSCTVS